MLRYKKRKKERGTMINFLRVPSCIKSKKHLNLNNWRQFMKTARLCLISLVVVGLSILFMAPSILAGERVSYKEIRGIMEKRCLFCHGPESPSIEEFLKHKEKYVAEMKGPKMDSYEALVEFVKGDEAGAIMRRLDDGVNTPTKKHGNMYTYLGDNEEERKANLATFKTWVGFWTLKKKKDLAPDEISRFLIPKE
jgi:hypothetical protein